MLYDTAQEKMLIYFKLYRNLMSFEGRLPVVCAMNMALDDEILHPLLEAPRSFPASPICQSLFLCSS